MKKKFVRVMFLGALTLAVSTAVTSCKDYDDDVKNLQEQIDKITSNNPVSKEDMQSAISSAITSLQSQLETAIAGKADNQAVVALQTKVTELTEALKGKVDASKVEELMKDIESLSKEVNSVKGSLDETKTNLEKEISDLKKQLENAAGKEEVDALTSQLAELQTKLTAVEQATKDNAATIATLTSQIAKLDDIQIAIKALQDADKEFVKTGDLAAYSTTEEMKELLNSELASYMTDTEIATYVSNAIQTLKETELKNLSDDLTEYNNTLTEHINAWNAFVEGSSIKTLKDVEDKLTTLGQFDAAISLALEKGEYADFAALVTQVNTLKTNYANCVTTENVNEKVNAALQAALKDNDSEFAKLSERVAKLEKEMGAMKNMIQSVTYIPTSSDRKVNFVTLHAKKDKNDAKFAVTLAGASTQEVKFRIAPATAAAEFATNYNVVFSADQAITRATLPTEMFKIVGEPVVDGGFITYTIQSNADQSYSVCMHVATKDDKVETLGKTDITSDYFAAILGDKYLVDAYYEAASTDKTIFYDQEGKDEGKADYNIGKVVLSVADNATGAPTSDVSLDEYPGFDVSKLATTFEVSNETYFKIEDGIVTLTKYNTPSYTDQTGDVTATVAATGFYTKEEAKSLGTVSVMKTAKTAEINYGEIKAIWKATDETIKAASFPLATIYDDPKVQLTASEFAALTGTPTQTNAKGDKAWFNVESNTNVLTATVKAQAPEGKYPIEVVFTSADKARVITVKATIVVGYPEITALTVNESFWDGEINNGKVGFTPTLNDDKKPSEITTEYTLSDLFPNYAEVQKVVDKISGATLAISVPDVDKIDGVTYDEATTILTFDKDAYTGYQDDGKTKATVKVVATVTLTGVTEPLQEYSAVVSIKNISGSWVAGKLTASLNDKAATYKLADNFAWNDMRGKAMWKSGAEVADEKDFGTKTPLSIYGLTAPTFKFVDAQGKDATCEYLSIDENSGELTFTTTGKGYEFIKPYTTYVMVVAESQWGDITGYKNNNIIAVTIPANAQ
jgi:polyhydroxyalkanoate synthesis regulator phasin